MRRSPPVSVLVLAITILATACDTPKLAANSTAGIIERIGPVTQEYWDYDMVGDSFPSAIMQVEGFLRLAPDNEVMINGAMGAYIGYGYGWIEDRIEVHDANDEYDEAEALRKRLRRMYRRAWDLGQHTLRNRDDGWDEARKGGVETLRAWLNEEFDDKDDAGVLLWAGQAWASYINLDMEEMDSIADLPLMKVLIERSIELDPDFLFMTGTMVLAVIASQEFPPDMKKSKMLFDRVLEGTDRASLIVQMQMARYYAVANDQPQLFKDLLQEVLDADDPLPENRLANLLARRRAERYLDQFDLFFTSVEGAPAANADTQEKE